MICTLILEAGHNVNFDTIINQNWDDFELLYIDTSDKKIDADEKILQHSFCKIIQSDRESQFSEILNQAQGKFITWIHPGEKWGDNYLQSLSDYLNNLNLDFNLIPAIFGFSYEQDDSTTFIANKIKKLKKTNSIANNIWYPTFYNPGIKYFFQTEIIKTYQIPVDYSVPSWQERYALFCAQYNLNIKTISGREPDFKEIILPFSLPWKTLGKHFNLQEYHSLMESKKEILTQSIFDRTFWVYKLRDYKLRLNNRIK